MRQVVCLLLVPFLAGPVLAAPSAGCTARRADIEAQITQARSQGDPGRLQGLERALQANGANCTDSSLAAAQRRDLAAAKKKVVTLRAGLDKADRKGDPKKIADLRAKLDEAQAELERAQQAMPP